MLREEMWEHEWRSKKRERDWNQEKLWVCGVYKEGGEINVRLNWAWVWVWQYQKEKEYAKT